jgi:hypothetical protein
MLEEKVSEGGGTGERSQAERVHLDYGSRTPQLKDHPRRDFKGMRDQGSDFLNSVGILALTAIETVEVVSRSAGRAFFNGTTDGSRATFELIHDLTRTAHDVVVDSAQIAVDTASDLGAQAVRAATVLTRQGQELSEIIGQAGQGMLRQTLKTLRQAERHDQVPVAAAVPIIVN